MGPRVRRFGWAGAVGILPALMVCVAHGVQAQVFTVGEKTATADIKTDFTPTRVELPDTQMTERGRRELVRDLEAEQGFAHRALPLGSIVTLMANGKLSPGSDEYKMMVYKKGQAAGPGDRVIVTALEIKPDRILVDLNGGPYVKHRFLRHIQIGVGGVETTPQQNDGAVPTGCRITLMFEGRVPEVTAPEVKALLQPIVDFGVKTGEQAYADTLPEPVKEAIQSHDVLVGMNHRMVLAALGQPEAKMREGASDGGKYEEWIYGHQPQTVRFVRFVGDRVSLVKVAALGKPIEIHDHDELAGYLPAAPTRTIAMGDAQADDSKAAAGPPTLRRPGEADPVEAGGGADVRKVKYPDQKQPFPNESKPATPPATTGTRPPGAPEMLLRPTPAA